MEKFLWLSMDSTELESNFEELSKAVPIDLGLEGILTIKDRMALVKVVNSYKKSAEYCSKDGYFVSEKRKLAFLLKRHEKGIFDEELGIKKRHYLDKAAAKEWKTKLAKEFHPDKNHGDVSLNYDEITSCINKIYRRMVGEA